MKKFKTLYKKTGTGKIQQWKIWVDGSTIYSESGQVGGKQIPSKDEIKLGKNTGRKNATTAEEQAIAEAKSRFTKKKKEGYVSSIEDAESGKVDSKVIKGGVIPMLAQTYKPGKKNKHIIFPCAVQPKLDGIRSLHKDGMWSRTRKLITSVPHINAAILLHPELFKTVLDGELYNHKYKDDFEKITSAVTIKKGLHKNHKLVQFHVYDLAIVGVDFKARYQWLEKAVKQLKKAMKKQGLKCPIKMVETRIVKNEEELLKAYEEFMELGYEGAMARNLESPYENPSPKYRSKHLQKIKVFEDAEFKVVGMSEGRGKLKGHVGRFFCEIDDKHGKRTFKVKLKGPTSNLKKYFNNEKLWKNKWMTVQFQGFSKKNYKPRFPVGLRFRDKNY